MSGLNYPLEQLITIKKKRYDLAVKTLEKRKEELQQEIRKLQEIEKERDKVLEHKQAKLTQLRQGLDEGISSDKIQQMKVYLKVVEEQLQEKEKKVAAQKKNVEKAEKQVEIARQDLFAKQKDLEKLEIHKKEWLREAAYWSDRKQAVEQDDLGSSTFSLRKRREKDSNP